jgi:hypothetical protein
MTDTHAVLAGSACEVGKQQGEWFAGKPDAARFFTSPLPERRIREMSCIFESHLFQGGGFSAQV